MGHGEAIPVVGRKVPLQTQPVVGGVSAVGATNLIAARINNPRQWIVTVGQAQRTDNQVTPWQNLTEGGSTYPGSFTAPAVPASISNDQALQCVLQWGAGGVLFSTRFDYPVAGAAFGLVADRVNLDVMLRVQSTSTVYATPGEVPVVSAFMVPGVAADPTPLRWLEHKVGAGAGASLFWSVKPWARQLRVVIDGLAGATNFVQFLDYNGGVLMPMTLDATAQANWDFTVDVPPQAVAFRFGNAAGTPTVALEWKIGLT